MTGDDSRFIIFGRTEVGYSWSSLPTYNLNNLMLVTNGGSFWAEQLTYGWYTTAAGNVLNVAGGTLWIGTLDFTVGTLRIESGTGTIDTLNMNGGTNAVLQTVGNFYIGHHGNLQAGDLRVGGTNMAITALSGELELGGWQIGAFSGDSGNVTMTGGQALITNASKSAVLVVGGAGSGTLRVDTGLVQADSLSVGAEPGASGLVTIDGPASRLSASDITVGAGGTIVATNAGTLQLESCTAPPSSIVLNGATLEFASSTPALASSAIVATNATFSFRNLSDVRLDLADPDFLGRIIRFGHTALQLAQATNIPVASLVFRDNDASTWSKLILNGGASAIRSESVLIDANSSLSALDAMVVISGSFTNRGALMVTNSTLRFIGPVTLSETSTFQGSQGILLFTGGLHLPKTDVIVPAGISIQASSIQSDGGKLIIDGGGIIPNDDGSVLAGSFVAQDGWVTFLDNSAAPSTLASRVAGLGLELIRSTNVPVFSQTFGTVGDGYERLRLGNRSCWRSKQLIVGQGGEMFVADSSATVTLTSGVFRVEQGGLFRSDTGTTNYVGFRSTSANATASVSGAGSTWIAPSGIALGASGSGNQMLVSDGGRLYADSATIGGSSSFNNRLTLSGAGSIFLATNGLRIAGYLNEFLIATGGVFTGSQILMTSSSSLLLQGAGATANCSMQVSLADTCKLQMSGGATLFASNMLLSVANISDPGTLCRLIGNLTIAAPLLSFQPDKVLVTQKAVVSTPSVSFSNTGSGQVIFTIQGGELYVTNLLGTGNLQANGSLELNGGLLCADKLTANSPYYSVVNIRAGQAQWTASDFASGVPLRIGDATNLASLKLLGGTNMCRSGVDIRPYSVLKGAGIVVGAVTNRGHMSPSSITIQGDLATLPTSELAFTVSGESSNPQICPLIVTGHVFLAGAVAISTRPGEAYSKSQTFVLIQSGNISSNFANVAFGERLLTADRLASFRVDKNDGNVIATDFRSEDLDGDGIEDAWAMQHFGVSPLFPGIGVKDLDGDTDGDGLSNRNEFYLGTDPNDASSGFFVRLETVRQGGANLHFPYRPNFHYTVKTSSDMLKWDDTSIEEFRFDASGQAVWTDLSAPVPKRFFKLVVTGKSQD